MNHGSAIGIVVVSSACFSEIAAAGSFETAEYVDLSIGNFWRMTGSINGIPYDGMIEVSGNQLVNGALTSRMDFKVPEDGSTGSISRFFTLDQAGLATHREDESGPGFTDTEIFNEPVTHIPAAMATGEVHHFSSSSTTTSTEGSSTGTQSGTTTFICEESVATPAGTFPAARLDFAWSWHSDFGHGFAGSGNIEETFWLARGLGFVAWERSETWSFNWGESGARTMSFELTDSNRLDDLFVPGDLTGDGVVDGLDIDPLVRVLTGGAAFDAAADLNEDGVIDGLDIDPFVQRLTGSAAGARAASIPEPATAGIWALIGSVALARRRSGR